MRSRILLSLIILGIVLSAVPLLAQGAIPVYPGSKPEFALDLTQKDFLPVIRQFIGMVPGLVGKIVGAQPSGQADPELEQALAAGAQAAQAVSAALAGVNQISVVAYPMPKKLSVDKVSDFYIQKAGLSKGWLRPVMVQRPEGSVQLYVKPDMAGIFGFAVGKGYVVAAKVDGRIDLVGLGKVLSELLPMIGMHAMGGVQEQPQQSGNEPGCLNVVLTDVGPQKVRVLAEIRQELGISPSEARELVASLPAVLLECASDSKVNELKATFESLGATIEVQKPQ